jgi:hypothetical protein
MRTPGLWLKKVETIHELSLQKTPVLCGSMLPEKNNLFWFVSDRKHGTIPVLGSPL